MSFDLDPSCTKCSFRPGSNPPEVHKQPPGRACPTSQAGRLLHVLPAVWTFNAKTLAPPLSPSPPARKWVLVRSVEYGPGQPGLRINFLLPNSFGLIASALLPVDVKQALAGMGVSQTQLRSPWTNALSKGIPIRRFPVEQPRAKL